MGTNNACTTQLVSSKQQLLAVVIATEFMITFMIIDRDSDNNHQVAV